jgi:hypothetical protein
MSLFDLKALYVAAEVTPGTDPSADGAGYSPLYAQDIAFAPTQDAIERPLQRPSLTKLGPVAGAKGGTVTFKLEVRGSGDSNVQAGDDASPGEADLLLEAVFGTKRVGKACAVAAGWTATGGAVTGTAHC